MKYELVGNFSFEDWEDGARGLHRNVGIHEEFEADTISAATDKAVEIVARYDRMWAKKDNYALSVELREYKSVWRSRFEADTPGRPAVTAVPATPPRYIEEPLT